MHAVISTPMFLADAKDAGLGPTERAAVSSVIAANHEQGDVIVGTGGVQKLRVAAPGASKSSSYRIFYYYAAEDVPVFLLRMLTKGQKANITKAERNALKGIVGTLADDYRAGVRRKLRQLKVARIGP